MLFVLCNHVANLVVHLSVCCLQFFKFVPHATLSSFAVDSVDGVCLSLWEGVFSKFMTLNTFILIYKHLC